MIRVDKDGNFSHPPDLIRISDLLNIHNLKIDLPNQLLDAEVDACLNLSIFTKINNKYEFKVDDYSVVIDPNDSEKPILEIEEGHIPAYYSWDGSYCIDYKPY